ncbi:Ldh family oxidoreductase [Candidatus Lucifugimonas marina]|jgi:LDH2 family malate/lactate/ureidoglycolate dehydrogenase|uniref:Ldh family oxidoreductase n=1 Tax=Candidatus Lucifugimonas marina TaxID=3038979 RepID=A0AAJ5ZDX9_9CHLR|nr:Ldh family oxidoreductase [SAR202 cluster bacterium JH702]MDG0869709.1 Ldh family oxidoreductase [SAR202 cluster bacterium JH639]WFG34440.1 Ldh family oxidoreductase [SAR202 cluster bacterium JH545]WFG38369.1 Ldh family oxidoreductase [SAR202 cluster bacterium JH1073]
MLERFKVPEQDRVYVSENNIREATEAILRHSGVPAEEAASSTDVLIKNDLRGVESHGVSNGLRRYVAEYGSNALNPTPNFKVERETKTTMTVDADGALGIHVGPWAMQQAIDKAKEFGMAAVAVKNSGHLAGCGYYAMMAAEQGMIGHCMTAGGALQTVPPFGSKPVMGTNPIAWAAPARNMPPFLFDVATTQVANNKIGLAGRIGADIEPGWIAGLDGEPILEPIPAPKIGEFYSLHIGGTRENGSHKGFGLALMNEIICNELSGFGSGPVHGNPGGHFFQAYDIEAFTDTEKFLDDMDSLLQYIVDVPPAKGFERVLYAGLKEDEDEKDRLANGIPYHREVVEWFESYCAESGIECNLR